MDYFLNENDLFDNEAGVEGFYIVSKSVSFYLYARLCAGYSRSMIRQKSNFPIKEQKDPPVNKKAKLHCLSWPGTIPPLRIPFLLFNVFFY